MEKLGEKPFFILEMANNHMGDAEHGLNIIRAFHEVVQGFSFIFGFKLQYRHLDTFIHPDFKGQQDIKYVKRFSETKLKESEFTALRDEIKKLGFVAICTPFDEPSVDLIEKHEYDMIKVGSCSFTDWPLLERIVKTKKQLILSTAGAELENMDKVVSFLEHRNKHFCLMHCVGEYPAAPKNLQLNQIDFLKRRYPEIPIGYSTHENPDNTQAVQIAIGKGARVLERHVGLETPKYTLNAYSSNPMQIRNWILSAQQAFAMCGEPSKRHSFTEKEKKDLRGLQRGIFAKKPLQAGEKLTVHNVFFAIPNSEGQVMANDFSKYREFTANARIEQNKPVMFKNVAQKDLRRQILGIITDVRKLLIDSKTFLPPKVEFELSHHYGIERFKECGAAIINCINREYCKKLIILLEGQRHPVHCHKKKEETFHVLYGDVTVNINNEEKDYKPGEMVVIERGIKHSFHSAKGAIFEEISTTHYPNDSFYDDAKIAQTKDRKTVMTFWSDWLAKPLS